MKSVEFIVDYRGVLTREIYYRAGSVVAFQPSTANALVKEGRARFFADDISDSPPSSSPSSPLSDVEPPLQSLDELRAMAKAAGIKGWHRMKESTLRKRLGL